MLMGVGGASFSKAQEGSRPGCALAQGWISRARPDALTPHAIASKGPLRRQQYQPHVRMEGRKAVQTEAHTALHNEAALDPALSTSSVLP